MSKTKIDFIVDVLTTKKLDSSQKERLFLLAANEIRKDGIDFRNISKEKETRKEETRYSNFRIHNPKNTINFLYRFSLSEQFKRFTHPENTSDFIYDTYIAIARKEFGDLEKLKINPQTWRNTHNFLFGSKDPYPDSWEIFDNIKINYGWKNVRDWCKEHYGEYPSKVPLPKEYKSPDKSNPDFILPTFGDVIKAFKHNIEIRNDDVYRTFDRTLKSLINKVGLNTDFNISYANGFEEVGKNLNVYTDVTLLLNGLKQILQWCLLHRAKSNEMILSITSENEYYELEILHKHSYLSFEPRSEKINGLAGELKKVRNYFFCICDWEMEAKLLDNNYYKLEFLNSRVNRVEQPANISEIPATDGVKHSIKLYKTINL